MKILKALGVLSLGFALVSPAQARTATAVKPTAIEMGLARYLLNQGPAGQAIHSQLMTMKQQGLKLTNVASARTVLSNLVSADAKLSENLLAGFEGKVQPFVDEASALLGELNTARAQQNAEFATVFASVQSNNAENCSLMSQARSTVPADLPSDVRQMWESANVQATDYYAMAYMAGVVDGLDGGASLQNMISFANGAAVSPALIGGTDALTNALVQVLAIDLAKGLEDGVLTAAERSDMRACAFARAAQKALAGGGREVSMDQVLNTARSLTNNCSIPLGIGATDANGNGTIDANEAVNVGACVNAM